MTAHASTIGVVGNLASLQAGQVLLPGFVVNRAEGIYVDVSALDSPDLLPRFVEQVFASDARFQGIDYPLFLKLLFEYTPADINQLLQRFESEGRKSEIRFAAAIVDFPRSRQELYRGLKIAGDGESAEYLFEQISREIEYEEMSYGDPDDTGVRPPTGLVTQTRSERAFLDFDEFVAAAWMKGLRYGIDEMAVRAALAADRSERVAIARQKPPAAGHDASVEERSNTLRRDDSPRLLPNGRIDLAHFSNRFPQVAAGTHLFRKLPRTLGVSGWSVQGKELPPEPVKDFDLESMSGPGTQVERQANGDWCIVATMDGFLDIDSASGKVSISDKIINRAGVSARTTGNLSLTGDEFEEYGEVQEKRVVSGRHMTFFADVYGDIHSDGGRIVLKQSITGGSAASTGGTIKVEGKASAATLIARRGDIEVATAEGSVLVGQVVRVASAVRCDIVAEEIFIETAEGCNIIGRRVSIGRTGARKNTGTQILLLLPDLVRHDADTATAVAELATTQAELAGCSALLAALTAEPDLKAYLSLQPKIKAGARGMTPAQEESWKALQKRIAPRLRDYATHQSSVQALQATVAETTARIAESQRERVAAVAAVCCTLGEVVGETIVRGRRVRIHSTPFDTLPPKELHVKAQETLPADERIFHDDVGSLVWPGGDVPD
jgi:hypothetical protein